MEDTQHDVRTAEDSAAPRADDSTASDSGAASVARLLANPRRIRRN